uniref:Chromo domain-containing protein n=1 Tax=Phytophthora ramorum TaxID=164328 RepID=H3GLR1_PHYRM
MPALKPKKNEFSSAKEFKTLLVTASKMHKIRVSNEAIRHLRLTMNTTIASASLLPEAINVIIASLAERKTRRVGLEDVREWLTPSAYDDDDTPDDCADEERKAEPVHYVEKLLNWKREKRVTYYLVDWQPTWEPKEHLNEKLVATFEEERRLLVRKTFIEEEAVEDNTLNDTET